MVHKKSTLIAVSVDCETPEESENKRLRDYAKSSGPAGVGMSSESRPEDKRDESLVDMAKRYAGKIADVGGDTVDALFGEDPPYRFREPQPSLMESNVEFSPSEDGGFTAVIKKGGSYDPIDPELLDNVREIDDSYGRDPDMVLMDWMGDEDRVDSKLLTDLYPSDEQIDYAVRRAAGEVLIPVVPDSVREMRDDMRDYNRFGGDAVAMELDRRDGAMSELESDDESILRALMEENVAYSGIQDASEGLSALREDLGRDVRADLIGQQGTITIYSAYSPQFGRLKYSYDSMTGTGRILERQ